MQVEGYSDLSLMKPIFIVSDIHAGIFQDANDASKLEDFKALLEHAQSEASELIMLGDSFDFWYEWKHVIPSQLFPWLSVLKSAVTNGLRVSIFPGNHDFRLGSFLSDKIGLIVCPEVVRREMFEKQVLMHHGDGLDPAEWPYRIMKRMIRNSISYRLFILLHPDVGMRLAFSASKNEKHVTWEPEEVVDTLSRALPPLLQQEQTDWVVFGHVHVPSLSSVGTTQVATLPAFTMPSRGYAVFNEEGMRFVFQRPEETGSEVFHLDKLEKKNA